jgi:pilus assembly protein CpaB
LNRITRLIFLLVALISAFAVSFVVYDKMTSTTVSQSREVGPVTTQIAVAVRDMGRGDKISATDIRMATFLQETAPGGHFTTPEQSVGRIVLSPITTTQPILESALAPKEMTKGGMAAIISPQKRAMAVKVDNVIGVAGFLHPGHLVDVLVSIEKDGENKRQITKTVLENILVLSVGTQAQESDDKKAKQVTVATLEVDLEEGEKLALAVNEGSIQLALRGYTDLEPVLTKGMTVDSLLKSYSPEVFVAQNTTTKTPMLRRERPRMIVEVMNGNKVDKITINR